MNAVEKIRMSTSALYDEGRGITDGPTRGLMLELLFYDLLSPEVRKRLTKGTFQKQSHKSNNGRNAKCQYDWLLLNKPVSEFPVLTLAGIPFGIYDEKDVLAVIEIKSGTAEVSSKTITNTSSSFWNLKRALGKPWVYIAFSGTKALYDFSHDTPDSSLNKKANGKYFCLWTFSTIKEKQDEQAEITLENFKAVEAYLKSLI